MAELAVAQEAGQAPEDFEIVLAGHPHLPEVAPFVPGNPPGHHVVSHTDNPAKREAAFAWAYWLGMDTSNAEAWLVNGTFPGFVGWRSDSLGTPADAGTEPSLGAARISAQLRTRRGRW